LINMEKFAYRITATLGPASRSEQTWDEMIGAGASAFRLNTSHLSLDELEQWLERLQRFLLTRGEQTGVVLDLQGSKWRTGRMDPVWLEAGQMVELHWTTEAGPEGVLPVPHRDFFEAAEFAAGEIVLNDAKVRLELVEVNKDRLQARVTQAGPVSSNKGITYAESQYRKEDLHEKDREILERTRGAENVQYAISYVRDAAEMQRYRALIGKEAYLATKLEREQAVAEGLQMEEAADELWLCRGDLGAEMGQAGMARAVSDFSSGVRESTLPVLMAGQVLEHMTVHPHPTRSEVCYLYDMLQKGYAGFVLSDETAVGENPVESCRAAAMFMRRGG
jgi:pyruvate kinase